MGADADLLFWIQDNLRFGAGDAFFSSVTHIYDLYLFGIIAGAVLIIFKKTRRTGFAVLLATALVALTVDVLLKNAMYRPRPFIEFPDIASLVVVADNSSFPSGHAAGVAAFAAVIALALRKTDLSGKTKIAAYAILAVFAAIMSFSRMYCFVHFPSDVLAGLILGAICGCIAYYAVLSRPIRKTASRCPFLQSTSKERRL